MSSNNVTIHHGEEINNSTGVSNKKLLMWAFLGSDVMFLEPLLEPSWLIEIKA